MKQCQKIEKFEPKTGTTLSVVKVSKYSNANQTEIYNQEFGTDRMFI